MTLIYTTIEAIARRLRGRLKVTTTLSPAVSPSYNTQQVVDPELISDIGNQVEAKLNMILGQIYELPLLNKHPILAGITERLVVSEIMLTHFQSTQSPELGGDPNFGGIMYKKAQEDLVMLVAGHNIAIAGVATPQNIPGVATPQPIVLPGEVLRLKQPDTLSRNYTVVAKSRHRNEHALYREWGINWEGNRALGSEEPIWY